MTFDIAGYSLLPILPELVLAVGAMLLLMIGAYGGARTVPAVTALAVVLLVVTIVLELTLPRDLASDNQPHRPATPAAAQTAPA